MMNKPKYILTVEYPNVTGKPLRTAMGIFENEEEAEAFKEEFYKDTNHICTVYPLNLIDIMRNQ